MLERNCRVLIVYYTFSQQAERVALAMAKAMELRACEVTTVRLDFTDPHYSLSNESVPMKTPILKIVAMLPGQLRRKTAEVRIPAEAQSGDYDLVVLGGPTWWLTASMPIRSYLDTPGARAVLNGKPFAGFSVSRRYWRGNIGTIQEMGEAAGGKWLGEAHFVAAGNQVMSMLSWLSYMRYGVQKERAFGLKIPPTNLQPGFEEQVSGFASRLLDQISERTANDAVLNSSEGKG